MPNDPCSRTTPQHGYPEGAQPHITPGHIDGPLLVLRDGRLHWLTLWERVCFVFGWHDAYSLERKHWRKA